MKANVRRTNWLVLLLFSATYMLSGVTELPGSCCYASTDSYVDTSLNQMGRHIVVELSGCTFLDADIDYEILLWYAAYRSGAEVLAVKSHTFSPQGWTGFALLGESHISVHTWPEHNYIALDVFTCGDKVDMIAPVMFFIELFNAKRVDYRVLDRGYYGLNEEEDAQ